MDPRLQAAPEKCRALAMDHSGGGYYLGFCIAGVPDGRGKWVSSLSTRCNEFWRDGVCIARGDGIPWRHDLAAWAPGRTAWKHPWPKGRKVPPARRGTRSQVVVAQARSAPGIVERLLHGNWLRLDASQARSAPERSPGGNGLRLDASQARSAVSGRNKPQMASGLPAGVPQARSPPERSPGGNGLTLDAYQARSAVSGRNKSPVATGSQIQGPQARSPPGIVERNPTGNEPILDACQARSASGNRSPPGRILPGFTARGTGPGGGILGRFWADLPGQDAPGGLQAPWRCLPRQHALQPLLHNSASGPSTAGRDPAGGVLPDFPGQNAMAPGRRIPKQSRWQPLVHNWASEPSLPEQGPGEILGGSWAIVPKQNAPCGLQAPWRFVLGQLSQRASLCNWCGVQCLAGSVVG
jgi:hypothetical protein